MHTTRVFPTLPNTLRNATTAAQRRVVDAYIAQLDAAKAFPRRIATQVGPLAALYRAP